MYVSYHHPPRTSTVTKMETDRDITATILPRLLIPHILPTHADTASRLIPAHYHVDADVLARNRLQSSQVQQYIFQRHGHLAHAFIHGHNPQWYQEEQSIIRSEEKRCSWCSRRNGRNTRESYHRSGRHKLLVQARD